MKTFYYRQSGEYYVSIYDDKMGIVASLNIKENNAVKTAFLFLCAKEDVEEFVLKAVPNTVEPGSERMLPDHPSYQQMDKSLPIYTQTAQVFKDGMDNGPPLELPSDPGANPDSKLFKYGHYFKDVSKLTHIDIYRVCDLWGVTNPALQHAIKKLLVAGGRGAKNVEQDLTEAADAIDRALQMLHEDGTK